MVSSPRQLPHSGSRNRDGTGDFRAFERFLVGFPLASGRPERIWPKFWPVVTKFRREAKLVRPCFGGTSHLLVGCDGEANSVGGLRCLRCCSPVGWCADGAGDTMPCCAFEYAEALDLSADRWAKMLVRRQEHDLEIVVALAAASCRGPRGPTGFQRSTSFRRSTNKDPHGEVHQSPGCPSVGYEQLRRFRSRAGARARSSTRRASRRRGPFRHFPLTCC